MNALGRGLGVVVLAWGELACGGSQRLEAARGRALGYFASQVESADPGWANLFGYMHRRFGLEARTAAGDPLHRLPPDAAQVRPELARLYLRLEDPDAAVPAAAIAALPTVIDRITANALHCDRIPLPDDWPTILRHASEVGGYALTHATLATEWTLEQGCWNDLELGSIRERQVELLAALVEDRASLVGRFEASTDLWIEALVMLYYVRAGARVEPGWLDALLEAQRPDGGWPRSPTASRSDPHPTALALWVLLENLEPDARPIRWIPPANASGAPAP